MGLAGNDSLEKPPMLLAELKGGFSYLAFLLVGATVYRCSSYFYYTLQVN